VLDEVRVVANHADTGGGGVSTTGEPAAEFSLIATRSLIAGNEGDGLENWGSVSLINTTVSGNSQAGIFTGGGGSTKLTHVTVAENNQAGLEAQPGSSIELVNTIVANNVPAQCFVPYALSAAGSLVGDSTCIVAIGNLSGVDPKLGPLHFSSVGLTWIHPLKKGSPAIDAGWPAGCESEDQRGVSRPIDGDGDGLATCDIGAFEYSPLKRFILEQ
jgi:hypothetical protein